MPTGTVTFLFTDIEGSTRLWDKQTEQMGSALARHDEILRGSIERHGGFVFTTAGDSFSAAFATAGDAVVAASEAQAVLRAESWPDATPIRVRMGLHSGVAEVRGSDYFGPDVIRAARIEAAGHGGQILLSEATASLMRDESLRSLGRHRLTGFDDEVELFQLGDDEYPPVRTTSRRRHNLPSADSPLLGREGILDEVVGLVEQHRLVTLTGPGGIGKTSVAKAAAYRLAARPDAEVWWCDLVSVDADDVGFAIGRSVGLMSGVRDAGAVAAVLAGRGESWLVVDNCEHVIDAVASAVDDLVAGCSARMVATSRVPIEVRDEVVVSLSPLDPDGAGAELLLREADRVGGLTGGDQGLAAVRAICARLDGIPLAVELVAARTRALSLVDIEERLDDLLRSSAGRRGDRHATMSAAIEWSVQLLDDDLRPGLGALAVFPSEFDLAAAEAILRTEIGRVPVEAIETLVAHSLIEAQQDDRGRVRYRMLEPIRQHVAGTLWRDPAATRHHHLDHFLDRLERAYDILGTSSCLPYLDVIDHDMADLAAVHDWALESGRIDDDLRLYRPLTFVWVHGRTEPYYWVVETAQLPGIEGHDNWGACWGMALFAINEHVERSVLIEFLNLHESVSPDDPSADLADLWFAVFEGHYTQLDWSDALARFERAASEDPAAMYLRHYWGAFDVWMAAEATGNRPIDEAIAESMEILDRGLGWAASIGARNIEAALLQGMARFFEYIGDHEAAAKTAREAELMSVAMGMTTTAQFASHNQLCAAMHGVEIVDDPHTRLVRLLESCVENNPESGVLPYVCRTAARPLAAIHDYETAALCMLQPTTFPDRLPPLATKDFPDDVWAWAEKQNRTLTTSDVGRRALETLRALPGPTAANPGSEVAGTN
jgi:predicted ATPase/class 3 adenylate cyclase